MILQSNAMKTLHFIPNFKAARISFDEILEAASKHIKSLPETKERSLKEDLENGLANLTSKDQLQMYLSAYGDIHRQKLMMAYDKIPNKVWQEGKLAVIDYGCGQCVAEMVLSDFMKQHYIDNDIISEFIMIEPSGASIKQGVKYLQSFFEDCEITTFNSTAGKITSDHLQTKAQTVIHIFSNVLDMPDFEREHIADLLNQDMSRNHILVCVSPFYQENGRGALMDNFGQLTRGMRCEYKFEKHTDDWDKSFSCQIRIFVSGYY